VPNKTLLQINNLDAIFKTQQMMFNQNFNLVLIPAIKLET